jgi:Type II CAAX prenyl endopeptidase Rce1-like
MGVGGLQQFTTALRATVLVFGISALATLANRAVANSGVNEWLLMNQLSFPGAIWFARVINTFTFGIAVVVIAFVVARNYWRGLLPGQMRWVVFAAAMTAGLVFAIFLNHPLHVFLFDVFFAQPIITNGATNDSVVGGIFSGLSQTQSLFTMPALATMLVTPFVEELTDRGILFKEAESLALWQVAVLSFLVFCFSHYLIGGFPKVLAVAPAAALFVGIRLATGSFVYSAAAHIGINAAALMKLQVW